MKDNPPLSARLLRGLRLLRSVRGYQRLIRLAYAPQKRPFRFDIIDDGARYQGSTDEFLFWHMFFLGSLRGPLIRKFCAATAARPSGVLLDIGANLGFTTLATHHAFPAVLAFEPNPRLASTFETLMRLNDVTNVTRHGFALGDADTTAPLRIENPRNTGTGTLLPTIAEEPDAYSLTVSVRRGDDVISSLGDPRVAAIKMDVQGFEPKVIDGLRQTIARDKPVILSEIYTDETRDFLLSRDFAAMLGGVDMFIEIVRGRVVRDTRVKKINGADLAGFTGDVLIVPQEI